MSHRPFFLHKNKQHFRLTTAQKHCRDTVYAKLENGSYRLEDVPCICGSRSTETISETDRYGFPIETQICCTCGLLRTNPRPDSSALTDFYTHEYRNLYMGPEYIDMQTYFENMIARGRGIVSLIRQMVPAIIFSGKRVLEIGCSAGGLLVPFSQEGCIVCGYDFDNRYLTYGMERYAQLDLRVGGIDSLKNSDEQFDIVIINHVLEHLPDPLTAIHTIWERLSDEGILYVGVPGVMNPQYYYSPTKSFLGSLHFAHLFHFTLGSLQRICSDFELLYGNDLIEAVFRKSTIGTSGNGISNVSEYEYTMKFLHEYERSPRGWCKRLYMVVRALPSLLTVILPEPVARRILAVYRMVRLKGRQK